MAEKQSDLLMKMVTTGGQGIAAGATSTLVKDDKLLSDFWAGKFFEVEDFGLGFELNDFETAGTANTGQTQQAACKWANSPVGGICAKPRRRSGKSPFPSIWSRSPSPV